MNNNLQTSDIRPDISMTLPTRGWYYILKDETPRKEQNVFIHLQFLTYFGGQKSL